MSETYLVGLDGSETAARALDYATAQAAKTGAALVLVHVIEWSGFDIMGPEEIAERHKIRDAEMEAAHANVIDPALAQVKAKGVPVDGLIHHGHATEFILTTAKERGIDHIFVGRNGTTRLEALIFGSTTNSLAQAAPVPVTVVP